MSLVDELQHHKAERVAALTSGWPGPATYDPYGYFSVFVLGHLVGQLLDRVFWVPWLVTMVFAVAWTVFVQLYSWCKHPPCSSLLSNLSSFTNFFALFQVTLALLMSFRLARCAVRFYDARAASGKMIEICRTLASETVVYCAHDSVVRDDILRWIAAFPVATKNFLRAQHGDVHEFLGILSVQEAEAVMAAPHQAIFVLDILRALVMQATLNHPANPAVAAMAFQGMTLSVNTLGGAMGAMERIGNTPLPYSYTVYLRTYIILYLLFALLLMGPSWGWYTILIMAILGWLILGLEAAATECERPVLSRMNHLPLERYCVVIADNVQQIAATFRPGWSNDQGFCMPWDRPRECNGTEGGTRRDASSRCDRAPSQARLVGDHAC